MRYRFGVIRVIMVLAVVSAVSGCGKLAGQQGRAIKKGTGTASVGLKEPCVGMGCEEEVSVGLKEKCVGMGCPPADAQQPE